MKTHTTPTSRPFASTRRRIRRGFNLVEMLIALGITAALMAAVMVALDASFKAYRASTEEASTHAVSRLAINRLLTMIRTGSDFGPLPDDPNDDTISSDFITFRTAPTPGCDEGLDVTLVWDDEAEALNIEVSNPCSGALTEHTLINGVIAVDDGEGGNVPPFVLEYHKGSRLYRATIDLTIVPDDDQSVDLEGDNNDQIRLVASAMPRSATY